MFHSGTEVIRARYHFGIKLGHNILTLNMDAARHSTTYIHTYTYSFTDPSSAQVGFNVEFVMKRAKLQYAIKSNK
jgi:hypothetical protein